MTGRPRGAAGAALVVALAGVLTACGNGGFSSAPPAPSQKIDSYVALGDGFTAAPYTGETAKDDGCLRSKDNYPALVAEQLGIAHFHDVSCTGTTTQALTERFNPVKGNDAVPPQFHALDKKTDLVTVGIGIEDGDLLHKMFAVCLTAQCAPGSAPAKAVLGIVDQIGSNVTRDLRTIQAKAPTAYIVVVGYPLITPPPDKACDAYPTQPTVPVGGTDPVTYLLDDLNSQLQSAARQTGSGYVDVAALSTNHVLCSAEPWVHDMHAKPGKSVAYHPVAAEQRAVADQIVTAVKQR